MQLSRLSWLLATETRRAVIVIVLWSVSIASVFAQALYQRSALTIFDQAAAFAICLVAGALITDIGKAILAYLGAMAIGLLLLFSIVTLPVTFGMIPPPGDVIVTALWVSIIFKAIFPFTFIAFLIASIIGAGLGETYL